MVRSSIRYTIFVFLGISGFQFLLTSMQKISSLPGTAHNPDLHGGRLAGHNRTTVIQVLASIRHIPSHGKPCIGTLNKRILVKLLNKRN
jgi:hypothetical protein